MLILKVAGTELEREACYKLRYEVLRRPWHQPRGSETDASENESVMMMVNEGDEVLGTGRLHFNTPAEAQIRYMAVRADCQGRGVGSMLLSGLERTAAKGGAAKVVLNARENALAFYLRHGYRLLKEVDTLYGQIRHFRMEKLTEHAG